MSLVQCRFNPNHKMKLSRREIHEQKCPDRFKCKKQFKYCPYNPLELIEESEYEEHCRNCKDRPKITKKDEEEIEKAKKMNDIATEQEKIKYARLKYYKDCVEEPEIPGLGKNKQQKKKTNKKIKKQFSELNQRDADRFAAMTGFENENDDDNENHNLEDFPADKNFNLDEDKEKNKNNFGNTKNKKEEEKKEEKKEEKNNKKEQNSNINTNSNSKNLFYKYDPNDEDKDIGKFSANILKPDQIYNILRET